MASTQQDVAVAEVCRASVSPPHMQGGLTCLVASASGARREDLRRSAQQVGWDVIAVADSKAALRTAARTIVQLAVVDFDSASREVSAGMAAMVEELVGQKTALLALCGHASQPEEEIWARQLGVWLYLPGVEDCTELTSLFGEAHELAARMAHVAAR